MVIVSQHIQNPRSQSDQQASLGIKCPTRVPTAPVTVLFATVLTAAAFPGAHSCAGSHARQGRERWRREPGRQQPGRDPGAGGGQGTGRPLSRAQCAAQALSGEQHLYPKQPLTVLRPSEPWGLGRQQCSLSCCSPGAFCLWGNSGPCLAVGCSFPL